MASHAPLVAPQHLHSVHQAVGTDLCQTMNFMREALVSLSAMRAKSAREYAELREANALINLIKKAGVDAPVRHDEIAWALSHVRGVFGRQAEGKWSQLLEKAAHMLEIDPTDTHPMPLDMARRIENELALLARFAAA